MDSPQAECVLVARMQLFSARAGALSQCVLSEAGALTGLSASSPRVRAILCGLTKSTRLNMFVVPTLYLKCGQPLASVVSQS